MSRANRNKFGNKVRALRLARGFTQETLADNAKLHPTYVGGIERGERNVGLDNIYKLAEAFDIEPSELFVVSVA